MSQKIVINFICLNLEASVIVLLALLEFSSIFNCLSNNKWHLPLRSLGPALGYEKENRLCWYNSVKWCQCKGLLKVQRDMEEGCLIHPWRMRKTLQAQTVERVLQAEGYNLGKHKTMWKSMEWRVSGRTCVLQPKTACGGQDEKWQERQ